MKLKLVQDSKSKSGPSCQQCLIVDILVSGVTGTTVSGGSITGISSVTDGSQLFQVANNQLQYWNGSSFVNFQSGYQYSNLDLHIYSDCSDGMYQVELCPQSSSKNMVIGNKTFTPYYAYQNITNIDINGNLSLMPDFNFSSSDCGSCINGGCA